VLQSLEENLLVLRNLFSSRSPTSFLLYYFYYIVLLNCKFHLQISLTRSLSLSLVFKGSTIFLVRNYFNEIYRRDIKIYRCYLYASQKFIFNCSIESNEKYESAKERVKVAVERIIGFDGRTGHNTRLVRDSLLDNAS